MEPDVARALQDVVRAYLSARRTWEIEAERLFEIGERQGDLGQQSDEIQRQYGAMLERYFTPQAAATSRSGSFGKPPSTDPDRVTFRGVRLERDRAVVSTSEFDLGPEGFRDYEYVLKRAHGT